MFFRNVCKIDWGFPSLPMKVVIITRGHWCYPVHVSEKQRNGFLPLRQTADLSCVTVKNTSHQNRSLGTRKLQGMTRPSPGLWGEKMASSFLFISLHNMWTGFWDCSHVDEREREFWKTNMLSHL